MQRGRGGSGRDNFFGFGDPFGDPFSAFNNHMNLTSSIFNGRDPFADPFFTRPFGNINSVFGLNPPSMFGGPSLFDRPANTHFIEDNNNNNNNNNNRSSRGVVIEEISSGGEEEEGGNERREKSRKHARSGGEAYVEEPGDDGERRIRHMQHRSRENEWVQQQQPQTRSFSFQSSTVTYGGANGAYYTSSTTRKMGDNGVMLEEKKEADTTTGKAEHKVSKGIYDKGHTVTRNLNPDGKVDTMQTLHNLNEDELAGFQETWKGNARKHLPGWAEGNHVLDNTGPSNSMRRLEQGWALPSSDQPSVPSKSTSQKASGSKWRG